MRDQPGTFIVLEGADGSGKGTQFRLLEARLKALGHEVEVFDFPRYDQPSSHFVRQYLNGHYGPAKQVSPYTASLFYALDRFEAGPDIKKALMAGKIVLSNRYVGSNMAHQGSKFSDPAQQRGFFVWEDNLEYELLGIPRPSVNIFLKVPPEVSFELIRQKAARSYTNKSHDEHEADITHLRKASDTYGLLCQLFPKDFIAIDCMQDGQLLGIPEISNRIWSAIMPLLPADKPNPARSLTLKLNDLPQNDLAEQSPTNSSPPNTLIYEASLSLLALGVMSAAGISWDYSRPKVTAKSQYYQPSRLPKRLQVVFDDTRGLWQRLNNQLETGLTHYIRSQRTEKTKADRTSEVQQAMDQLTPLALMVPATITVSKKQVPTVVEQLSACGLAETDELASELQVAAAGKWPADLQITDGKKPYRLRESSNTLMKLAQERLSQNLADTADRVKLLKSWPRNEFEILSASLYAFSNQAEDDIKAEVENWGYQQKYEAFQAIIQNALNLKHIRYHLDVVCDLWTINNLRQSGLASDAVAQPPTPRYGYEVPEIIEDAGLEDTYLEAFDGSLKLYSAFQSAQYPNQASYALLAGHKIRLNFSVDAAALAAEFAKATQAINYRSLLDSIKTKVAEVHPLLWESLSASDAVPRAKPVKARPRNRRRASRARRTRH